MKALVYHGPGQKAWETVPDPVIQEPTDVIVRIDSSTICGTDLHILKGDVPAVKPGWNRTNLQIRHSTSSWGHRWGHALRACGYA